MNQKENTIVNEKVLGEIFAANQKSFQMISLKEYLQKSLKGRGDGKNNTLNSHNERFIMENGDICDLKDINAGFPDDFLKIAGLHSIGNKFQKVNAVIQGYSANSDSCFERPVLEEGPHMVIGLYAFDQNNDLHIFRTLQMRTGRLIVDTPRGFATSTMLESGEQIYDADRNQATSNLLKIMKEETGKLEIKEISYLGADICNTSCITSKTALYAVEIDYIKFKQFSGIITDEEYTRRNDQLQHEGLIGGIVDMTVQEYLLYKNNSNITKDMTADCISDLIIMNHLAAKIH